MGTVAAAGNKYKVTESGKCPVCKSKIQVFEDDGVVFPNSTKYLKDGMTIEAKCPTCKRILIFVSK